MGFHRHAAKAARHGSVLTLLLATSACGSTSQQGTTQASPMQPPAKDDTGSAPDSGSSPDSDSSPDSGSSPDSNSSADPVASGSDAAPYADADGPDTAPSSPEAGEGSPEAAQPDAAPSCVKGQVTPNEVVMIGDSYLDHPWGNIGPTLMTVANAKYRHYYLGGAALAWGNPNTQLYIPYQFDPMALTDKSLMNPSDIKVVIMDGGGNDVLIGNTSCETTAPPANSSCVTTIQNAVNEAQSQFQKMAQKGVQSVVFFFYPHLDPAGGGILKTPAPAINETLDYAYPLAEKVCCGSSFTSSLTHYSCSGQPVAGSTCVFIDTRPAFEGHLADYIKSDHVHPTQAGAQVIANLIWSQMQSHCIAQ